MHTIREKYEILRVLMCAMQTGVRYGLMSLLWSCPFNGCVNQPGKLLIARVALLFYRIL